MTEKLIQLLDNLKELERLKTILIEKIIEEIEHGTS